ncbi:MAG: hypothetical protein IPJ38_19295 [Dechloromonas sp.]|uniref:Uncharacterized protein n=1 Tax=Candidatus Dechloromonas phosphorivorans TaxID=2899244 RepID=A0A935K0B1_9RHOO|nr:hypothetical protein [Candidatus Dechloromonas phosphorivorans]
MKINEYFLALNKKTQCIFSEVLNRETELGRVHDYSNKLYEISKHFDNNDERRMLTALCSQLESSCLTLTFGMYRQALASLRLSFELGLGEIYFSANKLEYKEWLNGTGDIKWSRLIDEDNGVLSLRFARAFNPCIKDHVLDFRNRSISVYRILSEYVHGNNDTWKECGLTLDRNQMLEDKYFQCFKEVCDILLFTLFCRYSSDFNELQRDDLNNVFDSLNHIAPIREYFGGPKDIK